MPQAMQTTITNGAAIGTYWIFNSVVLSYIFTADSMYSDQSINYLKSKYSLWLNRHILFFSKSVLGSFKMLTEGTDLKVLITEDLYT